MCQSPRRNRAAAALHAALLSLPVLILQCSAPSELMQAIEDVVNSGRIDIDVQVAGNSLPNGTVNRPILGALPAGSSETVFTIMNAGGGDLALTGIPLVQLSGDDAADFSVTSIPFSPVTEAQPSSFTLSFSPALSGTKHVSVTIPNNDPDENPYTFSLEAVAGAVPVISVYQGTPSSSIADGGAFPAAGWPSTLYGAPTQVEFTIRNFGTTTLTLGPVGLGGADPGSFDVTQPAGSIEPGSTTTFTVTFLAAAVGSSSAVVSIPCNDTGKSPFDFTVTASAAEWSGSKAIDSAGTVGRSTDVAVSGDSVFVSYYDVTNSSLKAARSENRGSTWTTATVGSTGSADQYGTSIAVSGASVFVSYYKASTGDLGFARSDDSGATWTVLRTPEATGSVGEYSSLAVSGSTVYIVYYDATNNRLRFVKSLDGGDTWGVPATIDATGGAYASLAAVSSSLYVTYTTSGGQKFARSTDSGMTWPAGSMKTIDAAGDGFGGIAVDGGTIAVSYWDSSAGTYFLRVAVSGDSGGTWNIRTADGTGRAGMHSSVAMSSPHILVSCNDATTPDDNLKFARSAAYDGLSWTQRTVDSAGWVGTDTAIGVDGSGRIYITCYDGSNGDLRIAKSADGGSTW